MTEHEHDHDCGDDCGHDHGDLSEAEQNEQMDKHFAEVSEQLDLLLSQVVLPDFLDPDDPLFGIFLDQPEQTDQREVVLKHVWAEHLSVADRIGSIERIDQYLQSNPGEKPTAAAEMVRDALLEPYTYIDTDWVQYRVSTERFFTGLDAYIAFWRSGDVPEPLEAFTIDLEQAGPDSDAAVAGLIEAGRAGVQATLFFLEAEYVEILSDFEALQEKGVEPLLRAIEVLAGVPSLAAATVLCDQLAIINHPEVEKALFSALLQMPESAARVAGDFIRFEPLQAATRFVLHELLFKVKSEEACQLMGDEFRLASIAEDQQMGADDLEDLAEMWAACAGPRMPLLASHLLTHEDLPEACRPHLQGVLDNAQDAELAAWIEQRAADELPVLFRTEEEAGEWAEKLAERWSCEPTDEKISQVLFETPAQPLFFFSSSEIEPSPGSKEQFLEKICRHEVVAETKRFLEETEEDIPTDEVQAWLMQNWWLRPRAESAWKPPLLAMLKERQKLMPDHPRLLALKFEPTIHSHLATAVRLLGKGEDLRLIDAHLSVASEMLPRDDVFLAYAGKLRTAMAKQAQAPKLWTPGEGGGGQAKVGRNDPCPCGSGKKYKKCCLGR